MSKIRKIQELYPEGADSGTIISYLKGVKERVEQEHECKIHTNFNRNPEYGRGWSYSVEKKGSTSSKYGNGNEESNLAAAILEAIKPVKKISLQFPRK